MASEAPHMPSAEVDDDGMLVTLMLLEEFDPCQPIELAIGVEVSTLFLKMNQ